MPDQVQLRGGSAADNDAFTGVNREVTVDTTNKTLRVHDGVTSGGSKLAAYDAWGRLQVADPVDAADATSKSYVDGAVAGSVPAGTVQTFAMNTAPDGWLKANGATISRTTYDALFAAIGTTFGEGDGSTTFEVPDLRGEFPRGWDDGRGVDSSRTFGSGQGDEFQGHYHAVSPNNTAMHVLRTNGAGPFATLGTGPSRQEVDIRNASAWDIGADGHGDPRYGDETRPRNVALLYCIKF